MLYIRYKAFLENDERNNRMGKTLRDLASNIRQNLIPCCPYCKEPFELENLTSFCSKEYAIRLKQQKLFEIIDLLVAC